MLVFPWEHVHRNMIRALLGEVLGGGRPEKSLHYGFTAMPCARFSVLCPLAKTRLIQYPVFHLLRKGDGRSQHLKGWVSAYRCFSSQAGAFSHAGTWRISGDLSACQNLAVLLKQTPEMLPNITTAQFDPTRKDDRSARQQSRPFPHPFSFCSSRLKCVTCRGSDPWPTRRMQPRVAMHAAQHKIAHLLKTFFFSHPFSLVLVGLMWGPRQLFFRCCPEMPKGWTRLYASAHLQLDLSCVTNSSAQEAAALENQHRRIFPSTGDGSRQPHFSGEPACPADFWWRTFNRY